jgi:hypothetical protein
MLKLESTSDYVKTLNVDFREFALLGLYFKQLGRELLLEESN